VSDKRAVTARRFCTCERPQVDLEGGVHYCIDCGHELEAQPVAAPAVDLIADRVVEKLAHQLGHREGWVDVKAAAAHLHCRPRRIYDQVADADRTGIPFGRDGSRLLFKLTALDEWVASRNGR
jgi:hypothetical protein